MDNSSKPLTYSEYQKLVRKSVIDNRLGKSFLRDMGISLGIGLFNGLIVYFFTKGVSDVLSPLALIVTTVFVYGIIYLIYFKIERVNIYNEQKKKIEDLLPEKPDINFSYSEFPQVKGRQKLKIINNSPSEIICHATLSFVAPLILNNFLKYPDHYYSKNLVWSNRKSADGDIKIDGNGGSAVLDLVETSEQKFNFLFQDGDNVKVGYDDHPEWNGLTENKYLLGLRLDGKFNGKNFLVEKKFLSSFEIRVLDEEKNKTMPFFTISEVVENSGGV